MLSVLSELVHTKAWALAEGSRLRGCGVRPTHKILAAFDNSLALGLSPMVIHCRSTEVEAAAAFLVS